MAFRIPPKLPPEARQSYVILQPKSTHFRKATCEEVNCPHNANGWSITIDMSTARGAKQKQLIKESGRRFTVAEKRGATVKLVFPAGQQCFEAHRKPLHHDPFFRVKGGDWRGNPRGIPDLVLRQDDWVDHFMEHQDKLNNEYQKG